MSAVLLHGPVLKVPVIYGVGRRVIGTYFWHLVRFCLMLLQCCVICGNCCTAYCMCHALSESAFKPLLLQILSSVRLL